MPSGKTHTFTPPKNPSQPGTPEWVYNEIMRHIEPDLLTTVIPQHPTMYGSESQQERIGRLKAYEQAFGIFDKAAVDFERRLSADVRALSLKTREAARTQEEREEQADAGTAESRLNAAA